MTGALIILAVTILTGLILYLTRGKSSATTPDSTPADTATTVDSPKTGSRKRRCVADAMPCVRKDC